jgi:hypothetical protein
LSADDLEGVAEVIRLYGLPFNLDGQELDDSDLHPDGSDPRDSYDKWPENLDVRNMGVHRDLVRAHLESGQRAVHTWLACQEDEGLERLVEPDATPESLEQLREQNNNPNWPTSLDALRKLLIFERLSELRSVLNRALSRFSVGLGELSDRNPSVYGVAFLQLYNHMLERAPALLCASETCGNRFVHQRGRAVHGHYRSQGVKYCSTNCARAQASRELRRRRRVSR